MKKLILLLTTFLMSLNLSAQEKPKKFKWIKDIFKYSTIFSSYSESSPLFVPETYFVTQGGDVINTTPEIENDYSLNFGIRKIARMDYENRDKKYYDGSEKTYSISSNVGAVNGIEYFAQYSKGKQQGREFRSQKYFLRYMANYWMFKLEYQRNGLINLDYQSADLRFRLPLNKSKSFSLSIGSVVRTHKPFGFLPINSYLENNAWWDLAYERGFMDHYYGIDYDNDGQLDNFDWWWSNPDGERIADTDQDFRANHYWRIVNSYNSEELNKIGTMATLSGVFGFDYYFYRDNKFWIHAWGSVYPIHKHIYGDEAYSYELFVDSDQWIDYNAGWIFGWYLNNSIGIFTELEKTRFWDKDLTFIKAGINLKL